MLQAYAVEGGSFKPISGDVAALGDAYWIAEPDDIVAMNFTGW